MTDAQLEWMIRNRKTISPAQRAEARKAWDAKYGSKKDPNRSTAEVSFGGSSPADLDPVEASATPITPDPILRKKPSLTSVMQAANTLASLENFNSAFEANGYDYPTAISAFTQQLIERGVEPEYAARAARARAAEHRAPSTPDAYADEMASTENPDELYPGYRNARAGRPADSTPPGYDEYSAGMAVASGSKPRAERLKDADATDARWDRMKEDYDRATGATQAPAPQRRAGRYDEAGRPGYDRTFTPKEVLAQRGELESGASGGTPLAFTVPSPRMPDGSDVSPGQPIYDEEQAAEYTQRTMDPKTGRLRPSPRDIAMRARGMVPVYNPDGSVGYSVEAYPENQMSFPGGVGRAGRRQDLIDKGWEAREVDGPTGKQTVYRPGATAQSRYDAQADARAASRLTRSAGISSAEAGALPLAEGETSPLTALRQKARNARDDDYNARNARWKAQAMLAGGQPTGGPRGTKAATNAFLMMNDPGLTDDQRSSLRYMLPGGQLAAGVDAANLQTAARLAQGAITGALAGGAGNPLVQMQMEQVQRDKAVARADALIAKYPQGWDGMYSTADVKAVRDAVEKQHPGHGDAAVAHLRVRPEPPPAPAGGIAPGSVPAV